MITRRSFLGLLAAPAIIPITNLMPVRSIARLLEPQLTLQVIPAKGFETWAKIMYSLGGRPITQWERIIDLAKGADITSLPVGALIHCVSLTVPMPDYQQTAELYVPGGEGERIQKGDTLHIPGVRIDAL